MATLTLRTTKGSPLTSAEVDDNFSQLDQTKIQLGGDVGGSTSSPTIISLRGNPLSSATPTTGQAIVWNGSTWIPQTVSTGSSGGSGNTVTVLNDISNQFNGRGQVFTLKVDTLPITESMDYVDNKDFTVNIAGRLYNAAVPQSTTLGPWHVDYTAEKTFSYKVSGSKIIFYRPIARRQTAEIRINNRSATRQKRRRYPLAANTIVFGD
jgi:hypothetical protein